MGLIFIISIWIIFFFLEKRYEVADLGDSATKQAVNKIHELPATNSSTTTTIVNQANNNDEHEIKDISKNINDSNSIVDFSVIAISAFDQTAIVKYLNKTEIVAIGQLVGDELLELIQITHEKLVLKNPKTNSVYWVYEMNDPRSNNVREFSSQIQLPKQEVLQSAAPQTSR